VRGWQEGSGLDLFHLAGQFALEGLRWLIYTDIGRDGMQTGFNSQTTIQLARQSGLQVIASGGVRSSEDIASAQQNGLAGIILGRALYEGKINLAKAIEDYQ
jgi:phosphoribosylformimino-5-aminoimidazole carboxamide ribotide isomerase